MARKLAESVNVFFSTLSFKSYTVLIVMREGFFNVVGKVTSLLPGGGTVVGVLRAVFGG
jgi:hypothetical protein